MRVTASLFAALALIASACGDSEPSQPDALDPSRVVLSGAVFDFEQLVAVEGMQICIFEDSETPCATSDSNGRYALTGSKSSDVLLEYSADGYQTKLRHVRIGEDDVDLVLFNMETHARIAEQFALVGVTADPTRGHVAVEVLGQREGATVALVPAAGDGPFYAGPGEDLDPALTAATEDGLGVAAMANVPEGVYSFVASAAGTTCTPAETPGAEASSALVRSVAGALSETFIVCE